MKLNKITLELKNICSDFIMMVMLILPVFITLMFRFAWPYLIIAISPFFDLGAYNTFISSIFMILTPMMLGCLTGFSLLDDRDENILMAISVTPLGKTRYVVKKLGLFSVISIILTVILLPLTKLSNQSFWITLPIILIGSLGAPIFALLLASFGGNKVEGLALAKMMSLCLVANFVRLLIPFPLHLIGGILPNYWITSAVLAQTSETFIESIVAGIIVHLLWIGFLFRIFNRRCG